MPVSYTHLASKNVTDDDALLLSCYDETSGAGFYVTGRVVGIFCNNGVARREERAYRQGEKLSLIHLCLC